MAANPYENVNAYSKVQKVQAQAVPSGSSRETDARALLLCAKKLDDSKKALAENPRSRGGLKVYGEAIRQNQQLWTIFQVALSDPHNQLPVQLKRTLLNLSRYVDRTSFAAIGRYRPDLIDSLVGINRALATGLSKKPTGDGAAQTQAMPPAQNIPISLTTSA